MVPRWLTAPWYNPKGKTGIAWYDPTVELDGLEGPLKQKGGLC
jgi:hypothetical protein